MAMWQHWSHYVEAMFHLDFFLWCDVTEVMDLDFSQPTFKGAIQEARGTLHDSVQEEFREPRNWGAKGMDVMWPCWWHLNNFVVDQWDGYFLVSRGCFKVKAFTCFMENNLM